MSIEASKGYDCAVIGGGPAGMMAAGRAAVCGARVALFEKNRALGRKLGITGKGRCNVTNNAPISEVIENINGKKGFLYSALSRFSPADTVAFFENLGVRLKTERGNRVFPETDRALDIVNAMRSFVRASGVEVKHIKADGLGCEDGKIVSVGAGGESFPVRAAVIATGGMSYPATGSTGDGYAFARALGHRVIPPKPSLVGLESPDPLCGECEGLALKNVSIRLFEDGKQVFEDFGEMLFTKNGVSGPVVLSASAHIGRDPGKKYALSIDLKPALTADMLEKRILRDFEGEKNKQFKNSLDDLLPASLRLPIVKRSGIPPDTKINSVTREQRRALAQLLKNITLSDIRPGPIEGAIVTSGGVDTDEINPKNIGSKLVRGLFFAGELIDVDGYTGGYNLQIAFSTGYAAGTGAAEYALGEY